MFRHILQPWTFVLLISLLGVKELDALMVEKDGHEESAQSGESSPEKYDRRRSHKYSGSDDNRDGFQEANQKRDLQYFYYNDMDSRSRPTEEDLLMDIFIRDDDDDDDNIEQEYEWSSDEENSKEEDEYDYYYYYYYTNPLEEDREEDALGLLSPRHSVDSGSNNGKQIMCYSRANSLRKKSSKQSKVPKADKNNKSPKAPKDPYYYNTYYPKTSWPTKSPKSNTYYPNTQRPTMSEVITCVPTSNPSPSPNVNPNPNPNPNPRPPSTPTISPSICDPAVDLNCPRGSPSPRMPTGPPGFPVTQNPPIIPPSAPSTNTASPTRGGDNQVPPTPNMNPGPIPPNIMPNPNPNQPPNEGPSQNCFALECPRATRPTS